MAASILEREAVELRTVTVAGNTAVNVEENTASDQRSLVHTTPGPLDRHELDDLYGVTLGAAVGVPAAVMTGSAWPDGLGGAAATVVRELADTVEVRPLD